MIRIKRNKVDPAKEAIIARALADPVGRERLRAAFCAPLNPRVHFCDGSVRAVIHAPNQDTSEIPNCAHCGFKHTLLSPSEKAP